MFIVTEYAALKTTLIDHLQATFIFITYSVFSEPSVECVWQHKTCDIWWEDLWQDSLYQLPGGWNH